MRDRLIMKEFAVRHHGVARFGINKVFKKKQKTVYKVYHFQRQVRASRDNYLF